MDNSFSEIPAHIRHYIEEQILPRYMAFDSAHRIAHVEKVIASSIALARPRGLSMPMAYVIAAFHDLGLSIDRKMHHIHSGEILLADVNLPKWFSPREIKIMKEAVEDHRASSKAAPRSIYGMIVAEADRSIDPVDTLRRTVQFGIDNYPLLSRQEHYARFVNHLYEKYSENGYIRLWLPDSPNAEPLALLRAIIADSQNLPSVFSRIYDSLRP